MEEQIKQLVEQLKKYNDQYRLGNPLISDAEYDTLVAQLRELDPNNAWLQAIEPAPISLSRKRKLPNPMRSLNKAKSLVDIQKWLKSLAIPDKAKLVIMPKFDGVSWLHDESTGATYSRGGSENEGQDCTAHFLAGNFKDYDSIGTPLVNNYTFGELVFNRTAWEENFENRISETTGEKYRSPRNTIAGLINRDQASKALMYADFFRYGVGETDLQNYLTFEEMINSLNNSFRQSSEFISVVAADELSDELLSKLFVRWARQYYIDGLVIYINDLYLWGVIGRQATTGNPLYAMAYKHPDFTAAFSTIVKGITWNVSKAGALKPVVNIEPIDNGDCIMENPTGYNAGWCVNNHVGKGAKILVTRSGGVIPKILETLKPSYCEHPRFCPVCGSPTRFDDKGIELYCTNEDCQGRRLAKINHFFKTVGVENIGEEMLSKFFEAGHDTIYKLVNITAKDILAIDGFAAGTANIVLGEMKKLKEGIDLAVLMHASDCFQGIGKIKAQQILEGLTSSQLKALTEGGEYPNYPTFNDFTTLPKTKQSFYSGIKPFQQFAKKLQLPIKIFIAKADQIIDGKYSGMAVCFSGVRDNALEQKIQTEGGKIVSGVSKNTTHLIVSDKSATTTKISKAQQLGIPILTIDEFLVL